MLGHAFGRPMRSGKPTRLQVLPNRQDPHRLGGYPDELGLYPVPERSWAQFQTFWNGNQYPGLTIPALPYQLPNGAIPVTVPGSASFAQLRGGAIAQQVGAVTTARLIDLMRAAWASTQS